MTQLTDLLLENVLCIPRQGVTQCTYISSEEADPVAVPPAMDDDGEESLVVLVCNAHQLCTLCYAGL